MKNTENSYGSVAKGFHWIVGLLMIGLVIVGLIMDDFEAPFKFEVYGWHKALGIAVLALASLRLIWRFMNVQPKSMPTHKPWEKTLAHAAHWALYAAMFIMPLSGWAMSSAGGYPIDFFGLFEVPPLVEKNKELGGIFHEIHEIAGYALIGLIGLHAAGAIKHHVLDKDDTLRRMLPFSK